MVRVIAFPIFLPLIFWSITVESVVSPSKAAAFPLPLPVSGSCTAGTEYTITSVDDLFRNIGDLECIFAGGYTPLAAPLGYSYGTLLTAANTGFWDPIANLAYQGDFTVRTTCQGNYYTIGWLSVAGIKPGTAVWYVGDAAEAILYPLAHGEYPLTANRDTIVMDFTVNFKALCPTEGDESSIGMFGFSPYWNSIWPLNQFVDVAVIVGQDAVDGGYISLNKAYMQPKNIDEGAATILFYATKSFDPDVFAYSVPPVVVPPGPNGETTIYYDRAAALAVLTRLNPYRILGDHTEMMRMTMMRESGDIRFSMNPNDWNKHTTSPENVFSSIFQGIYRNNPELIQKLLADSMSVRGVDTNDMSLKDMLIASGAVDDESSEVDMNKFIEKLSETAVRSVSTARSSESLEDPKTWTSALFDTNDALNKMRSMLREITEE